MANSFFSTIKFSPYGTAKRMQQTIWLTYLSNFFSMQKFGEYDYQEHGLETLSRLKGRAKYQFKYLI